jgi:hypothetical protein
MNIVMPVDFQSFSPSQEGLGTADARAENDQRNIIESAQNTSNANQTRQDGQSGSKSNNQEGFSTQHTAGQDKVNLSKEGKKAAEKENNKDLSEEDQKQVKDLKDRDREVRVHEQAHAAVGGQYAGSPSYEYQTGPDGKRYAVGGEVSIDVSEEEKPEDTIQKMQIVRAAALAPAEQSTQDLKVAAEASQKENQARSQVSQKQLNGGSTEDAMSAAKINKENNHSTTSKQAQAYKDVSAYQASSSFSVSA